MTRFEKGNQVSEGHYSSTYGYVVINYNPFIIYSCNTCALEIYNDRLDAAAYVSLAEVFLLAQYSIPVLIMLFIL